MRDLLIILEPFEKAIVDDRDAFIETLTRGMAKDYADYRYTVGKIEALNSVLDGIKEMVDKQERASD